MQTILSAPWLKQCSIISESPNTKMVNFSKTKELLFSGRAGQAQLWKEKAAREAASAPAQAVASAPAQAVIRGEETLPFSAEDAGFAIVPWMPMTIETTDTHPGIAKTGLSLLPPQYVCMKCDLEVNPLKCTQKGPQKWLCGKCNYKGVKCYRLFGHWPIEAFKGID